MSENLILNLINNKQLNDTEMYKLKTIFNMLVINKNYNYNLDDFVNKYHNGNKEEKIELIELLNFTHNFNNSHYQNFLNYLEKHQGLIYKTFFDFLDDLNNKKFNLNLEINNELLLLVRVLTTRPLGDICDKFYKNRNIDEAGFKHDFPKNDFLKYNRCLNFIFENLITKDSYSFFLQNEFNFAFFFKTILFQKYAKNLIYFEGLDVQKNINKINLKIFDKIKEFVDTVYSDNNDKSNFLNKIFDSNHIIFEPNIIIDNFLKEDGKYYIKSDNKDTSYYFQIKSYFDININNVNFFRKSDLSLTDKYDIYNDLPKKIINELNSTLRYFNYYFKNNNFDLNSCNVITNEKDLFVYEALKDVSNEVFSLSKILGYSIYFDINDANIFMKNVIESMKNNNIINNNFFINNISKTISLNYKQNKSNDLIFNDEFLYNNKLNQNLKNHLNMYLKNPEEVKYFICFFKMHLYSNYYDEYKDEVGEILNVFRENNAYMLNNGEKEIEKINSLFVKNYLENEKYKVSYDFFRNEFLNILLEDENKSNIKDLLFLDDFIVFVYDFFDFKKNNSIDNEQGDTSIKDLVGYLKMYFSNLLKIALFSNNELFEDLKKDNFFHKYYQNYKELLTDEAYCLNHENNYKFIGNSLVFSHQKTDVNFVDRMSYMDKIISYDDKKLNNKKRVKI